MIPARWAPDRRRRNGAPRCGSLASPELIIAAAARLSSSLRRTDLAMRDAAIAEGHLVARLGGDEFVILLDGIGAAGPAIAVAERIISDWFAVREAQLRQ